MIQTRKKRIVLFLPHRADPGRGEMFSADLLPLELLQISSGPAAAGYEVVLIDAGAEIDGYTADVTRTFGATSTVACAYWAMVH